MKTTFLQISSLSRQTLPTHGPLCPCRTLSRFVSVHYSNYIWIKAFLIWYNLKTELLFIIKDTKKLILEFIVILKHYKYLTRLFKHSYVWLSFVNSLLTSFEIGLLGKVRLHIDRELRLRVACSGNQPISVSRLI